MPKSAADVRADLAAHLDFLAEAGAGFVLRGAGATGAAGPAAAPAAFSWTDIYPFDRTALSPVPGHVSRLTPRLLAGVPYGAPGIGEPDVGLTARLVDAEIPGRLLAAVAERMRAEIHGACIGAGIELPAFVSRVTAHPAAWFQLPEVGMGLVPGAGGTVSLPRRIGRECKPVEVLALRIQCDEIPGDILDPLLGSRLQPVPFAAPQAVQGGNCHRRSN